MVQCNIFPGGVKRIVTFSYDDGAPQDERLVSLFNKYGVKATFHLNGGNYADITPEECERLRRRYEGHEIACHTASHGWMTEMPAVSAMREVADNRRLLEKIAGYPVRGMSYPSGDGNKEVEHILAACGIVYCRTTANECHAPFPENFLSWGPTCHHKGAEALIPDFVAHVDDEKTQWKRPLLYIWGHSHELRTEEDWAMMERIVSALAGNPKIWYATNIEIYDYLQATKMLRVNMEETVFENPTARDVWVEKDKSLVIRIPAGSTVRL